MIPPGRFVTVGGQRVHLVTDGAGDPPLLLTSGLGGAWYDWAPLLPHLPAARVVRFDRPGLGHSPVRRSVPTLAEEVDRLAGVIEHLTGDGAVVVAHSLAGLHAEALTRWFPGMVRGLVLVDPSEGPAGPVAPSWLRERCARAGWALARAADRTGLSPRLGPPAYAAAVRLTCTRPIPAEVLAPARNTFCSAVAAAAAWREQLGYRSMLRDLDVLRRDEFPTVATRLLTASGDLTRSAALRWFRRHHRLADTLGARHRLVPGAGHFLAWERPEVVAEAIRDVVARSR